MAFKWGMRCSKIPQVITLHKTLKNKNKSGAFQYRQKNLGLLLLFCSFQVLLELLSKVAEENEQQAENEKTAAVQLQCLKCQAEFFQPPCKNLMRASSEPDDGYQYKAEKTHIAGKKKQKILSMKCSYSQVIRAKTGYHIILMLLLI